VGRSAPAGGESPSLATRFGRTPARLACFTFAPPRCKVAPTKHERHDNHAIIVDLVHQSISLERRSLSSDDREDRGTTRPGSLNVVRDAAAAMTSSYKPCSIPGKWPATFSSTPTRSSSAVAAQTSARGACPIVARDQPRPHRAEPFARRRGPSSTSWRLTATIEPACSSARPSCRSARPMCRACSTISRRRLARATGRGTSSLRCGYGPCAGRAEAVVHRR
jgi:hypothetical protein